jgi:hypothetical protein
MIRLAETYQIVPFKNMMTNKSDPAAIKNLDLHLYKLPKIFPIFAHFKSLQRLNLSTNDLFQQKIE